jgi:hypothetical protein
VGIYVIIFGLGKRRSCPTSLRLRKEADLGNPAIAGLELLPQVPPYLPKYASFLFSFLGRGVC